MQRNSAGKLIFREWVCVCELYSLTAHWEIDKGAYLAYSRIKIGVSYCHFNLKALNPLFFLSFSYVKPQKRGENRRMKNELATLHPELSLTKSKRHCQNMNIVNLLLSIFFYTILKWIVFTCEMYKKLTDCRLNASLVLLSVGNDRLNICNSSKENWCKIFRIELGIWNKLFCVSIFCFLSIGKREESYCTLFFFYCHCIGGIEWNTIEDNNVL